MTTIALPERLSVPEVAVKLGLSAKTVRLIVARGELAVLPVPGPQKIAAASVEAYVAELHRMAGTAATA